MRIIKGLSFSFKRWSGFTGLRLRFSRWLGIPTTKYGLQRKIGAFVLKFLYFIGIVIFIWILILIKEFIDLVVV